MLNSTAMSGVFRTLRAGMLIGAVGAFALPVVAQEAAPQEDEVSRLSTVTVTARKTEENLQDVPVAVSAFTGEFFEDSGLLEFTDIARITPNFDVREDGVASGVFSDITIRGQSSLAVGLNSDEAVGITVNDAPITRGTNLFSNLFDVEQIEVLKGPQGTLFGKNTTGGAVIVRTTAPKIGEFEAYVEADIGNFNRRDLEGVVNIPLGDTAALRLGAATQERDGFAFGVSNSGPGTPFEPTGREFQDDDEQFLRASFLLEPNDDFSLRINADYHTVDEGGVAQRVLNDGLLAGVIPVAVSTLPANDFFAASDFRDPEPIAEAEEYNVNAKVTYNLGGITLESITAYREQEALSAATFAFLADIFIGQDSNIFSQEFRLSGSTDRLQWQGGVFYADEEGIDRNDVGGSGRFAEAKNQTAAIFGQGTFAITDRLNTTVGLRYTDESRSLAQIAHATETLVPEQEVSFDAISWTAGLDYEISENVLTYGTISRGFKSGLIDVEELDQLTSPDGVLDLNDLTIDPEFVTNYEIGLKGDFLNNTLRWNSALWYSDYTDVQVQVFSTSPNVDPTGSPPIVVRNGAEATLYGFETEVTYFPTDQLSFGGSLGYTKGEFDEFIDLDENFEPTVDRSDEEIGGPEWTFSAFGRYDFDVNENISGGLQLNYLYRGEEEILAGANLEVFEDQSQGILDSYGIVNAQLDFDIESWDTTVAFYGRNILDEEYDSSGFATVAFGLDLAQRIPGAPRTYGVRIRKSF